MIQVQNIFSLFQCDVFKYAYVTYAEIPLLSMLQLHAITGLPAKHAHWRMYKRHWEQMRF